MENYNNEKSDILTPNYKWMKPTLFQKSIWNSFIKSEIFIPYFLFEMHQNKYWNSQK